MTEAEGEVVERDEDEYALDPEVVDAILDAVEAGDAARIDELMEPLHAADIADLFEQIGYNDRAALIGLWSRGIDGEILSELDESIREEVIELLPHEVLTEAVRELDSDDVVDLIEDLEEPQQERILGALEDSDRAAVEQSLTYPEYSAGRLMQREVVTAPDDWTVGQAIDFLRNAKELPDQFYHVILIDPRWHPTGYVTLGKLLSSKRAVPLTDITEDSFRTIDVLEEEGDVAYAFNQYHLISAPVVDADDRLVGVITIDDAMAVLDEEHEEDILRLAGVGEGSLSDSVVETTKQRLPWLAVNLVTAILASIVIAQFEGVIGRIVALAVLMPIVASMGGNAGTQALTVAVRAIATRDLTGSNMWRVVRREATVGLFNGVIFAVVMGAVGWFWFGSAMIGVVLAAAMVVNLVVAGLAGILVPVALEKAGVDPALASGAFVTTVTDVVGFFAFLGLAAVVLL
ncbi:magnesium transporter [Defluviimonas sp. WL0024]|uniref:Magnesium transporter MgtE n=2 Tax=Albidovulum TaxID=205889 RepID=A0ABT3J3A2_9RHOB|nr:MULTISPECIES: magnesium transporter [Defluviimonas]MCU9848775.1 magnesium transporter [Defluviimonas sp. WL0024]MCW3782161.1 magnesium transporter [Defluviimonas salinarum]